jgi:hypothetical protein
LPFFLLAGRWREVAALTAVLSLAGADLFAIGLSHHQWLYIALVMLAWAGITAAMLVTVARVVAARGRVAAQSPVRPAHRLGD